MSKLKILVYQNYLEAIRASRGCKMFRRLYVLENGKKRDILKNGNLSCAYHVSSILNFFGLILSPHATVKSTVKDMLENGWEKTKKLVPGNVLVWEERKGVDEILHRHIGFYLGDGKAISNSSKNGVPSIHHYTYGKNKKGKPKRKIIQILTHTIIRLSDSRTDK
ncbi:hypothetical protein KKG85_00065 [Patescibacteria group bacterium]|nr:hypothetical protein [Patescibacteria group bacterium]MBU2579432.1 hypothetical protein [Patescibacteria group bacterium]